MVWSKLNRQQLGTYAEYLVKMEFTKHKDFNVFAAEVDDRVLLLCYDIMALIKMIQNTTIYKLNRLDRKIQAMFSFQNLSSMVLISM